jgi:glutaconate CoA-transferase, subunit B
VTDTLRFLVRAAHEFRRGGWVFTGFHWPVLAGQLAARLPAEPGEPGEPADPGFVQCFEAGAGVWGAARLVPSSTTDYPSYSNGLHYVAESGDVLLALARRFDRVVLDAANVDLRGRVNSSFIGRREQPAVRLPGGGGSADIVARAAEVVWLHGGDDPRRVQARVEHVTAAPAADALVRLHCRWGTVRLGAHPALEQIVPDAEGAEGFATHLAALGVDVTQAVPCPDARPDELAAARAVLVDAAERGYDVAVRALRQEREETAQ